ncbi:MAG: Cas10/Cmr2 second palm domain-containing protein [Hyphomicrobiaceae bacterium]
MPTARERELGMHFVHIEFRGIQHFLFAVPRLRAMVGANALVGDMLRHRLPQLAQRCGTAAPPPPDGKFPSTKVDHDPLFAEDKPQDDLDKGIISRDGGHFEALFPADASDFVKEVSKLIADRLPGLGFDIRVIPAHLPDLGFIRVDGEKASKAEARDLVDLPHFQVCEFSGRGPAFGRIGSKDEQPWASFEAATRIASGERFATYQRTGRKAYDTVSLLQPHLALADLAAPQDFKDLCDRDYLAVVFADGNNVGGGKPQPKNLRERLEEQAFYRAARAANRAAVQAAIASAVDTWKRTSIKQDFRFRPYQLLMLGGDDFLMACRAPMALPFLVAYARELKKYSMPDGRHLTIGAGVAIARPNVPFYRLHEIAETLAQSAKRKHRGLPENERKIVSIADWAVFTASWAGDPIAARAKEVLRYVNGRKLVLSGRPLPLLGSGLDSVEGLLEAAERIDQDVRDGNAARSQLRTLCQDLSRGMMSGMASFAALPSETRDVLKDQKLDGAWQLCGNGKNEKWVMSRIPDLVEVFEIWRLGRRKSTQAAGSSKASPNAPATAQGGQS